MNAYDLDAKLSEMLKHDGIAADSTTLRAAINTAYRGFCQQTKRNRLKVRLGAVPPAWTPADLGEVAVAMPLLTDGTPQFWEVFAVWYPDTNTAGALPALQFELRETLLVLKDVTTDGTSTLTVEGLAFPEPLVNDADTPTLCPTDTHMALVWDAYAEWASVYATEPLQQARITFYQRLSEQKKALVSPRVRRMPLQRSGHLPAVRRITLP